MGIPAWLDQAWREAGVREGERGASNSRILAFYAEVGKPDITSDGVAWCAAFAGACLERAGLKSTRSLLARSYLNWGEPITEMRVGAIAVLTRGADPTQGHVGFLLGEQGNQIFLLGGNQRDAVNVQAFDKSRLIGLRWPAERSPQAASASREGFDAALAHVLEMEGGYTDDPSDPGGPTNRGITLATYAAYKGVALTDATREQLKAELKALSMAAVRPIYAKRYWSPSQSERLPAALALMHFDAAVNHGVGGAARMLQEALAVTVDGEIGPETLAAARAARVQDVLRRYAEIRRARYCALPHFSRFGRGWLRRVDITLAKAEGLISAPSSIPRSASKGETSMQRPSKDTTTDSKWWGQSVTIWGAVVTTVSTVLPLVGPLIGISVSSDVIQQLGEQLVQVVQAVGGLAGIGMTIYGRSRASAQLDRREFTLRL